MTEYRRIRRQPFGDRTLVAVATVGTRARKLPRARVTASVQPPMPGVAFHEVVEVIPLHPGWRVGGDTVLPNMDSVLVHLAGYGIGAIRAQAERWTEAMS